MVTIIKETMEVNKKLDDHLQRYAEMLAEAQLESEEQRNLRLGWPKRFLQLCKFHLCVLIDVPVDFFNEYQLTYGGTDWDVFKRQSSATSPKSEVIPQKQSKRNQMKPWQRIKNAALGGAFGSSQSSVQPRKANDDATWENIKTLMNLIDNEEYIKTEGIFRKSGNAVRVRLIRHALCEEKPLDLTSLQTAEPRPWVPAGKQGVQKTEPAQPVQQAICVHDLASALKGALSDLKEPVLTKVLIPLFREVAGLTTGHFDDNGQRVPLRPIERRLAEGKQLKALRLLCLLMPEKHRDMFQRLLRLLRKGLQHSDTNRLAPVTLGTLFGPLLLSPKEAPINEMQIQYSHLANLTTLMINQGAEGLWKMPTSFAHDVDQCFSGLQRPQSQSLDLDDLDATMTVASSQEPVSEAISVDSGIEGTDGSQNGDVDGAPRNKKVVRKVVTETVASNLTPTKVSRKCKSFQVESDDDMDEEDAPLRTCLRFGAVANPEDSDAEPMEQATHSETKSALNQLYLAIQAMPDNDPKKSRLVKRFNKTNGGLPQCTKEAGKHSRTPVKKASTNNERVNKITWAVTQPLSPTNHGYTPRGNVITGNSAFRAARNIRSSLRRKLSVCSITQKAGDCSSISQVDGSGGSEKVKEILFESQEELETDGVESVTQSANADLGVPLERGPFTSPACHQVTPSRLD